MINAALVSAQNRERCYWVGIRQNDGSYITADIPQPTDKGILLKDILVSGSAINPMKKGDKARTQMARYWKNSAINAFRSQASTFGGDTMVAEYLQEPKTIERSIEHIEPVSVAQRGRYINSNNRGEKVDGGTYQAIEMRTDNKANCITRVSKDSMVLSPHRVGEFENVGDGKNVQGYRVYSEDGKSTSQTANSGGLGATTGLYAIKTPVQLGHISNTNSQANRVYSVQGKSVCLQSQAGGGGAKTGLYKLDLPDGDYIIRKLFPIEAERLMVLPPDYTLYGDYGDGDKKHHGIMKVADTNRYKCIGNGWVVAVIVHIILNVLYA